MARTRSADLLILAAHPLELAGLRAVLGPALAGRVHARRITCAAVGVGLPAAGIGTAMALRAIRPRAAVLLGSCGAYGGSLRERALQVAVPASLQLTDAGVARNQAAYPGPMAVEAQAHLRLHAGLCRGQVNLLRGRVANTLGITTDDRLARELARASESETENLEALGVALACRAEDVPFAAVLVVTNIVGKHGRSQWLANHRAAAARGAEFLLRWLARGAPGLPR